MADPATGIAALRRPVTVTAEGRLSEIKLTPGSTLHVVAPDYAATRALLGEMLEALLDAGLPEAPDLPADRVGMK